MMRASSVSASTGAAPERRRLAADVDQIRALRFDRERGFDGSAGIERMRVAKRIRGDVEDAHHERPPAQFEHAAAREWNIKMRANAHSCGSGLFSAGTMGARSFWRGRASSSSTGEAAARGAAGLQIFKRQSGNDAPDLIAVEHFARQQLVGHLHQRVFVLAEELVRPVVVRRDKPLDLVIDLQRGVFAVVLMLRELR